MSEYGFSLTRIFPYKDRIEDFVLIRENAGQKKLVFWYILRSVCLQMKTNLINQSSDNFSHLFLDNLMKFRLEKTRLQVMFEFLLFQKLEMHLKMDCCFYKAFFDSTFDKLNCLFKNVFAKIKAFIC